MCDLDKVRSMILPGLGWKLVRAWSTDYQYVVRDEKPQSRRSAGAGPIHRCRYPYAEELPRKPKTSVTPMDCGPHSLGWPAPGRV
jgi:hypothetical protein